MARSLKKLIKDVMDLLATNAPLLVINHDNKTYRMQLTAEAGFFTVLVRPPADWPAVAPVLMAFSLRDLYIVGYEDNADEGVWKLYDDAYLVGSEADDPANANAWQYLNFSGGYNQEMYGVSIGMPPMYYALQTLNNPLANDMAKRLALGVYIMVLPEACQFPPSKRHLVGHLRRYETMILINDPNRFDIYFPDWSSICKRVRKGPGRFIAGDGFATYKLLIEVLLVVLSRPPDDEL
ncbi:hypothetical protein SETIT_3G285500v2 [Setaria italica]|uniref:Uncharacterized protein n=1 Tax=Setaria italica TaxID=4555 RepID=A0A368QJW6_SETIT|nr:hypothetical protein SETIT_3G285500v2 [Setaria italica]